ncbi:MAG: hypothetical protein ACOYNN_04200 [Terrimicrobiaceae bacterium]
MRLYYDLSLEAFVQSPNNRSAVTAITLKRGNTSTVEFIPCRDGVVVELGASAAGSLMFKKSTQFGGEDPLVSDGAWTKTGTGTTTIYTFAPDLNVTELNDFLVDGTITGSVANAAARYALSTPVLNSIYRQTSDGTYWQCTIPASSGSSTGWARAPQKTSVSLIGEIEWSDAGVFSTPTLSVTVNNDVIKGGEGIPTTAVPAYPSPSQIPLLRLDITNETGGTATDLDGIPTTSINLSTFPLLYLVCTGTSGAIQGWQLTSGTDAENVANGIVRPDDYNASTNAKVWKLKF